MLGATPDSDSPLTSLLARLRTDQDRGALLSLEEYWELFPGEAEVIAREYLALTEEGTAPSSSTSAARLQIEDHLGPYRLLEAIGRGGQGVVYLAEDTNLQRNVALKVLTNIGPGSEDTVKRFRREAELASKLDHPGICAIYEAGVQDQVPYIAMRHVEGETVAQRISNARTPHDSESTIGTIGFFETKREEQESADIGTGRSTRTRGEVDRLCEFFERAARALHVAHESGVIHRDIKPSNIMITNDGDPVILDFGLARDLEGDQLTLTRTGDLFGTPAYMSPEQLTAQRIPLDRRTDVYSLGVSLYEALTLTKPFEAPTRAALYQAIMADEPSDARRLNAAIPIDLKVVLDTVLEKNRDRRYQTALDLAEDLRRVRAFEPIHARPISRALRVKRWAQRHPGPAVALCSAFLLLAVGLVISLLFLGQLNRSHEDLQVSFGRTRALALASASAKAGESDQVLALHLAIEAVEVHRGPETVSQLHRAFNEACERATLVHDAGRIDRMALSSDERFILTASGSLVRLWTHEGRLISTYRHAGHVWSVAFGPAGQDRLILAACADKKAYLWDRTDPRQPLRTFEHDAAVTSACFDTDKSRRAILTACLEDRVMIWDCEDSRKPTVVFENMEPASVARFSRDGTQVLTAHAGEAQLRKIEGAGPVQVFANRRSSPHHWQSNWDAQFSPDESLVLRATGQKVVQLWHRDGRLRTELRGNTAEVSGTCFSPDGSMILTTTSNKTARLFTPNGFQVAAFRGHRDHKVNSPTFTKDGRKILTACYDGTVRQWEVPPFIIHDEYVSSAFFTPSGTQILTASGDGTARLSDLEGREIATFAHGRPLSCAAISNDGKLVATVGAHPHFRIKIWDLFGNPRGVPMSGHTAWIETITFSQDDSQVLTASGDSTARIWSVDTGEIVQTFPHESFVPCATYAPDGEHVITACASGGTFLWNIESGLGMPLINVSEAHATIDVRTVVHSPDGGSILIAGADGVVRIFDLEGSLLKELRGHGGALLGASFSPDGKLIATASRDGTARLWSRDGTLITIFAEHDGIVRDALFDPEGRRLVTCSWDGTARIWHVDTDELLEEARKRLVRALTPDQLRPYASLLQR